MAVEILEIRAQLGGESVVEATVGPWFKKPGESVTADENVVELETDKVNVVVPAGVAGVLQNILRQTGDTVGANEVLATVIKNGANGSNGVKDKDPAPPIPPVPPVPPTPIPDPPQEVNATPTAIVMMQQNGVSPSDVKGTGLNGKITIEDVNSHLERLTGKEPAPPTPTPIPPDPIPTPPIPPRVEIKNPLLSEERREVVEEMSRLRRTIARHLVEGQHNAAMLTTFNEVDMTAVMEIRKRRKDAFKEKYGVGLGFMSFFTKAVVGALKAFPYLNAEIRDEDKIVKKLYYDIGIAVGTDRGLVVPVVRDANKLTFAGIEKAIVEVAGKARANTLTIAELTGGTFTITNGGTYGSMMSTPILNAPQVGILGMHKIEERPIALNGQVVIRPMMYLALSYDHRIVDGAEAVRFLVRVKELLEDPESLLLEG